MKRRGIKLTPTAYMHYMKKRRLNPNHRTHNIQSIKGDVKLPLHTCTTYQREVNHFNMKYTQHESIYREDVKLPLHISNIYIKTLRYQLKIYQFMIKVSISKHYDIN